MPTYGYRCETCGTEFDLWQRMTDEAKADCPSCSGPGKRLFFPAGIVFKGSGFYKTDSRGSSGSHSDAPSTTPATTSKPAGGGDPAKGTSAPSSPNKPSGGDGGSSKPSGGEGGSTPSAPSTSSDTPGS